MHFNDTVKLVAYRTYLRCEIRNWSIQLLVLVVKSTAKFKDLLCKSILVFKIFFTLNYMILADPENFAPLYFLFVNIFKISGKKILKTEAGIYTKTVYIPASVSHG